MLIDQLRENLGAFKFCSEKNAEFTLHHRLSIKSDCTVKAWYREFSDDFGQREEYKKHARWFYGPK